MLAKVARSVSIARVMREYCEHLVRFLKLAWLSRLAKVVLTKMWERLPTLAIMSRSDSLSRLARLASLVRLTRTSSLTSLARFSSLARLTILARLAKLLR